MPALRSALTLTAAAACSVVSFTLAPAAMAQSFPSRPIVIVIPLAPGGGTESETRMYSAKVTENEGYSIVVENRPGAAGTIGAAHVAKSPADGHTLMQTILGNVLSPITYPDLTYDPIKDFTPIVLMSKRPLILMVHPSLPVKNVAEYLNYAKNNPGKINYSTGGVGGSTHLPGAWLHHASKTEVTFVHYKSTGAFLPDLYAGRVQATATTPSNALASIKAGKVRGLGVTSKERIPTMPDLPSISETLPEYDFSSWMGFTGPRGMPAAVVTRLNRDFIKAMNDPAIHKKLVDGAIIPTGSTPAEFGALLAKEAAHWAKFIKDTGIKLSE
jgi:tripartite-type tricarboxylate transporter receptor subunit TctC